MMGDLDKIIRDHRDQGRPQGVSVASTGIFPTWISVGISNNSFYSPNNMGNGVARIMQCGRGGGVQHKLSYTFCQSRKIVMVL